MKLFSYLISLSLWIVYLKAPKSFPFFFFQISNTYSLQKISKYKHTGKNNSFYCQSLIIAINCGRLNYVIQKGMSKSTPPECENVNLFGIRVFAGVIKVRIEWVSHMIPTNTVLIKGRETKDTDTHREEGHVKIEAEIRTILTQAKELNWHKPESITQGGLLYFFVYKFLC